jgi:heme exporter protein D
MNEFIEMGGHGGYVWSAYGITFLVLLVSGWSASRRHRQALRMAQQSEGSAAPTRRPKVTEL